MALASTAFRSLHRGSLRRSVRRPSVRTMDDMLGIDWRTEVILPACWHAADRTTSMAIAALRRIAFDFIMIAHDLRSCPRRSFGC